MVSVLILSFLAGGLAMGGAAHMLSGIQKVKLSIFGKKMLAVVGVFFGWLELIGAVLLWHVAPMATHPRAAFVGAAIGVLLAGLIMSLSWLGKLVHSK